MRLKWVTVLAGIFMLVVIMLTAYRGAVAAPTGELTIVSPMIGNQIPIQWEEVGQANEWMKLFYDPLVGTTSDAELSGDAGLAEKWEMSPDGLTWTFYLRKGIKFHNGDEVIAKDAKFTIEQVSKSKVYNASLLERKSKARR